MRYKLSWVYLFTRLVKLHYPCKVKRLFLYLADKAGHEWLNHISLDKVDLGAGKRAIVHDGVYVSKYQITVPKELEVVHG